MVTKYSARILYFQDFESKMSKEDIDAEVPEKNRRGKWKSLKRAGTSVSLLFYHDRKLSKSHKFIAWTFSKMGKIHCQLANDWTYFVKHKRKHLHCHKTVWCSGYSTLA